MGVVANPRGDARGWYGDAPLALEERIPVPGCDRGRIGLGFVGDGGIAAFPTAHNGCVGGLQPYDMECGVRGATPRNYTSPGHRLGKWYNKQNTGLKARSIHAPFRPSRRLGRNDLGYPISSHWMNHDPVRLKFEFESMGVRCDHRCFLTGSRVIDHDQLFLLLEKRAVRVWV